MQNTDSNMPDRRSARAGELTEPLEPGAPPDAELGRVKKETERSLDPYRHVSTG